MKRVLVAGGKGFLGRSITKKLKDAGHHVTIVSRSSKDEKDVVTWDALKAEGLPEKIDVVINLSGAPILDLQKFWTEKYKKECVDSRVNTTKFLAEIAAESKHKPEAFIATSAVGYYPPSTTAKYRESYESSSVLDGWAVNLCHQIEGATKPAKAAGIRTVAIRMGVIMGRGGGAYANMEFPFKMGLGGPFGDGKQWFPWIHLEDASSMYTWAMENKKVEGPLNAVSPNCVSNAGFVTALAGAMWRPAIFAVPAFALKLIGKERAPMLLEGQHVIPAKAVDFGFNFTYPTVASACDEIVNGKD